MPRSPGYGANWRFRSQCALVRDRRAAARSAERVLRWPFERVVTAHNQVVDTDAYAQVTPTFAML